MFGFSVFLGSDLTPEIENYIKQLSKHGFTGIFTSLHIPEDDATHYLKRITQLGYLAKKLNLTLMVDISTKALSTLGFDLEYDIDPIKELGITGLRMDYGISMETIATISQKITVGLNASTLSQENIDDLKKWDADFSNMEFWHNYYPREETGLEKEEFIEKNKWLKKLGGKIMAFTPGDDVLRGPLFSGLPTLEKHRFSHPLAASIEILTECFVDEVYIGDSQILPATITQFKTYLDDNIILLHSYFFSENYHHLLEGIHTNRMDVARDVIRSQEARFKKIPTIKQINTIERTAGSITLDNELYGRYMGELQIAKTKLNADSRVNVMGQVFPKDINLLQWIRAGQKYQFVRGD